MQDCICITLYTNKWNSCWTQWFRQVKCDWCTFIRLWISRQQDASRQAIRAYPQFSKVSQLQFMFSRSPFSDDYWWRKWYTKLIWKQSLTFGYVEYTKRLWKGAPFTISRLSTSLSQQHQQIFHQRQNKQLHWSDNTLTRTRHWFRSQAILNLAGMHEPYWSMFISSWWCWLGWSRVNCIDEAKSKGWQWWWLAWISRGYYWDFKVQGANRRCHQPIRDNQWGTHWKVESCTLCWQRKG